MLFHDSGHGSGRRVTASTRPGFLNRRIPNTEQSKGRWGFQDTESTGPPSPALGPCFQRISREDVVAKVGSEKPKAVISDCKYVGSYNWIDDNGQHTVMIPAWTPLETPTPLNEDAGQFFRDPNAARHPDFPIEPAYRAIFAHDKSFAMEEVDIFACGSTLGNLLRFVRKVDKPFRFTAEVVGRTVFFVRRENTPTETIEGVRGYGHTFPEAYTTWEGDTAGSQSHQRLVNYDFAGLNCIVRFESDGYLKHLQTTSAPEEGRYVISKGARTSQTTIKAGGHVVSQDAVFDLKTRSVKRKGHDVLGDEIGRLWITQTPNFVLAYHDRGLFNDVHVQDVRREIQEWEAENQDSLTQLAAVIRRIVEIAKDTDAGRVEIRRHEGDMLEIHEQLPDAPRPLPPTLLESWAAKRASDDSSDEILSEDGEEGYFLGDSDDGGGVLFNSDDDSDQDYTACSAEDCGYCGHCRY
ncbi:hypothetical protein SLS55_003157 [Diplodia seriata]|uniref:Geranylgeranyl pyrophosphate synthetase n=1 Tax=Diplodia seriata TaxID=420778 RepID=A0ABR3CM84_9PEZI